MKVLQTKKYENILYGTSEVCKRQIEVNVQFIWEESRDEDKFIRQFAKSYAHELIHLLVEDILENLFALGEERAIRKMLKEKWNKKVERYYSEKRLL